MSDRKPSSGETRNLRRIADDLEAHGEHDLMVGAILDAADKIDRLDGAHDVRESLRFNRWVFLCALFVVTNGAIARVLFEVREQGKTTRAACGAHVDGGSGR